MMFVAHQICILYFGKGVAPEREQRVAPKRGASA